jgi:alkylated DNA repair dioxygenase AlkB
MLPIKRKRNRSKSPENGGKVQKFKAPAPRKPRVSIPEDELDENSRQVADSALATYKVDMPDASIYYIPDLISPQTASEWYDQLADLPTWYRPTLKVYGKSVLQSRDIAAYATDPSLAVKYSGTNVVLHTDYPPVLSAIQGAVEDKLSVKFNHVMLNRYGTGDVYIGLHSDGLENRVIATVSVGAERTFIMRHRTLKGEVRRRKLGSGSLFVMQGDTQRFWKHEIPKEPKIKEGRISLTFRQLLF